MTTCKQDVICKICKQCLQRKFCAQTFDCIVRFCAACPKISSLYGNLLKYVTAAGRSVHRAIPFLSKVNHSLYQFPPRCGSILGAYWYTSVGKASPFLLGAIIVPSLGLFWYIIVPFLGICFSVPLLVQEMYQNKPKSGTFSAPEKFIPDLVQSVAHSAPKSGTLPD